MILVRLLLTIFFALVFLINLTVPVRAAVALTPPMGWSTWNLLGCGEGVYDPGPWDENTIKGIADAMVSSGLKDAGYEYINLDDCWGELDQDERGPSTPLKYDTQKFPSGIKDLADDIHAKGLKLGIYTSFSTRTCQWRWGSLDHEQQDIDTFASWGIDYLKVDYCKDLDDNLDTRIPELVARYRTAINSRPIVLSIAPHQGDAWTWAPPLVNLWRFDTFEDIKNEWDSVLSLLDNPDLHHPGVVGPGHFADADMLEVGVDPVAMPPGMTDAEYRSHFSLWAILASPLIMGNDLRAMSTATKNILSNTEIIAVNQDAAGREGVRIKQSGETEIWLKSLANPNEKAIILFNRGSSAQNISVTWTDISLPAGKASVRDLWAHVDRGEFTNSYSANVERHGVVMLKITSGTYVSPTPTPVSPTPTPKPGDISGDKRVDTTDLMLILKNWLGNGACVLNSQTLNCDLNGDAKINSLDAAIVLINFLK